MLKKARREITQREAVIMAWKKYRKGKEFKLYDLEDDVRDILRGKAIRSVIGLKRYISGSGFTATMRDLRQDYVFNIGDTVFDYKVIDSRHGIYRKLA